MGTLEFVFCCLGINASFRSLDYTYYGYYGYVVGQNFPDILSTPNISPVHHAVYKMLHRWSISVLILVLGHMACSVCILLDDRTWKIDIDAYVSAYIIHLNVHQQRQYSALHPLEERNNLVG